MASAARKPVEETSMRRKGTSKFLFYFISF
jgi:hypothetical protein